MKPCGFVQSVTDAVAVGSDNWEIKYYQGEMDAEGHLEFDQRKLSTYMHSRYAALGPEWRSLQRCIMRARGELPRLWIEEPGTHVVSDVANFVDVQSA